MKIKSFFVDIFGSLRVTRRRKDAVKNASIEPDSKDPIAKTARLLHPGKISLRVVSILPASSDSKTYRLMTLNNIPMPHFKAGQYMTLEMKIDSSYVTRPYAISSAPFEAKEENYIEITIRSGHHKGFVSDFIYDNIRVGDILIGEIGLGQFFVDPIRDSNQIVAIAGGSAVATFLSMAREIKNEKSNKEMILFYCNDSSKDMLLIHELEKCLCEKFKMIKVISNPEDNGGEEKGLITSKMITKYVSFEDPTFFISGPPMMYGHVLKQLEELHVPKRRIRTEGYYQTRDVSQGRNYPVEKIDETFEIKVLQGIKETLIKAFAKESLAVALERAGIYVHTCCRSGVCGSCRGKVEAGQFYINPDFDVRRAIDKDFDYVHLCSTYPLSDMVIRINIGE